MIPNLNKLTKAELINKLKAKPQNKTTQSPTFLEIVLKFKTYILSLTLISLLLRLFKDYKSIRALLKIANYIVWAIFGLSIYDAFGFAFVVNFFGEIKYIWGSIITYLMSTEIYKYMTSILPTVKENESARTGYKKPVEVDWKAEFEKAERQREIDKWKERYAQHKDDDTDYKKSILILLLLLGGSIGAWYYGKDALDWIWGAHTLSDLIKKILRGGRDDNNNDDDDAISILLEGERRVLNAVDKRASSPDMVYSSAPPAPPAPPAPVDQPVASSSKIPESIAPPARTEQGPPTEQGSRASVLEQIKAGKRLRKAVTIEKTAKLEAPSSATLLESLPGKDLDKPSNPLTSALSAGLDKIKSKMIKAGDDDFDSDIPENDLGGWDNNKENIIESSQTTPTNKTLEDKGWDNIYKGKGKQKFLDSISNDDSNKIMSPSKIANILTDITKQFPNLSPETLEKLSTVEGLKNRKAIIESLPMEELIQDKVSFDLKSYLDDKKENISDKDILEGKDKINQPFKYVMTQSDLEERGITDTDDLKVIISKGKSLQTLEDLKNEDKQKFMEASLKVKPDVLINQLKHLPDFVENSYVDSIVTKNIDNRIEEIIRDSSNINKQQMVERLIQENPLNKDKILSVIRNSMDSQLESLKQRFSEKEFAKISKVIEKEDLKEIQSLSENRTEDQIKTLTTINKSRGKFLQELKSKSSKSSFNTNHLDDTMNLFD